MVGEAASHSKALRAKENGVFSFPNLFVTPAESKLSSPFHPHSV
jgi:hypothetical protein